MKKGTYPSLLTCRRLAPCLFALGATWFLVRSAEGQNLLQNGDFEQPLGSTNWTVGYLHGGPDDWEIKDRSRGAARRPSTFYGGYFQTLAIKLAHVYFTQTVTNLTPGHVYNFSGHMRQNWWDGTDITDSHRDKVLIYVELIGGQGTPLPCGDGRFSMIATNNLTDSNGSTDTNIDAPYTYPTFIWRPFFAQQTPDANGKIEVRLHYNKKGYVTYDKLYTSAGSFDDLSLVP